jgi:hypothetical protein
MRIETALKLERRWESEIHNVYMNAKRFHWSFNRVQKYYHAALYEQPEYKKAPKWLQARMYGFVSCERRFLDNALICAYWVNGRWYAVHSPEYEKLVSGPKGYAIVSDAASALVYKENHQAVYHTSDEQRKKAEKQGWDSADYLNVD